MPEPSWKGRLKVISKGNECIVKLEDKISGELFAMCPVDAFPGVAVEPVSDSSRYFILRLLDPSGRHAFVGLGFEDRGDAFDFNVALQDHFKQVKQSQEIAEEEATPVVHKDYSLKAGEKIKINLKNTGESSSKPQSSHNIGMTSSSGILAPPPSSGGGIKPLNPPPTKQPQAHEDWGDFTSFGSSNAASNPSSSEDGNWVQF